MANLGHQSIHIKLKDEPNPNIVDIELNGHQHSVQQTWSSFGLLSEAHRKILIKGLLERCSTIEIDYICNLLNVNLSKSSQVRF